MNRFGFGPSEEHQPVTWWRGHPVYAAHFIVIVFVASMLVTTLLLFARVGPPQVAGVQQRPCPRQVWRIVTMVW